MKNLSFLLVLFLFCACAKENVLPESGQPDTRTSSPGHLYNVSVSVTDNKMSISCSGTNISLKNVYVAGNGGFHASAIFNGNTSVLVNIPGYGYYSITVSYVNLQTTSEETYALAYDYRAGGGQIVPPVPLKCSHNFSNFFKNATRTMYNGQLSFTVCFTGNFKAVFYPVNIIQGAHFQDLVRTVYLSWSGSPVYETLTVARSPYAAYELRIYSPECNLPLGECTHYLKVSGGSSFNITNEPVWFDEYRAN